MDSKNPDVRDLLRDCHHFLINILGDEILSETAKVQREELLQKLSLFLFPDVMPPYIDMNGCNKNKNVSEEYMDVNTSESNSESKLYEEFPDQSASQCANEEGTSAVLHYENLTIPVSRMKDVAKKFGPLWRKAKILFVEHSTCSWGGILGDALYIYNSDREAKPASVIHIRGFEARPAPAYCMRDGKKRDCCFELVCPGRKSYQFIARTAKDMEQWIACINEASCIGLEEADMEMTQRRRQLPSLPQSLNGSKDYDDIHSSKGEETDEKIYHAIGELNIAVEISRMPLEADEIDGDLVYDDVHANNHSRMYYNMKEHKRSGTTESSRRVSDKENKTLYDDEEDIYDDIGILMRSPDISKSMHVGNEPPNSIQNLVQNTETGCKKCNFPCVVPETVKYIRVDKVGNSDTPSDNFYEPIDKQIDDS